MATSTICLQFKNNLYTIKPTMELVAEIEHELGSIKNLQFRMVHDLWKISDVVSLMHMMLASAGKTIDYVVLGDCMLQDGMEKYKAQALAVLNKILGV